MPPIPPPDYSQVTSEDTGETVQGSDQSSGGGGRDGAPLFFEVSIPPTATPGAEMVVKSPEGHDIKFIVPVGCPAGGVVRLQY